MGIPQDRWRVRLKVWLEIDGHPVIGEGRLAMLSAIDQYGAIKDAARALGISYRKMRGAISDMEMTTGTCLVRTHRGGEQRGGAALTDPARDLVQRYLTVTREFAHRTKFQCQPVKTKNLPPNGRNCPSVPQGECDEIL